MKSLAFLLLFAQSSFQLPTAQDSSPKLVSRYHVESPYVVDLQTPYNRRLGRRQYNTNGTNLTTSGGGYVVDNFSGGKYLLPLTVAGETVNVEIDTGSADTWIIQKGFQCWHTANEKTLQFKGKLPEKQCNFGPAVPLDSSFTLIPDLVQFTCYGQGGEDTNRCLKGHFYNATVDMFGVEIQGVNLALPLNSSFPARGQAGIQSGLMGLGFPALTGALTEVDGQIEKKLYPSIMDVLFNNNTFDPPLPKMFSMALSRDQSQKLQAGKFAVGGIPSLNYPDVNVSSTTPVSSPLVADATFTNQSLSTYSISIDGYSIDGQTYGANTVITIDSGADTFQLPSNLSSKIDSLWSPPGVVQQGQLLVNCTADLPDIGIVVNGTTLYVQKKDLITPINDNGICATMYAPGPEGEPILVGDPFLYNVLAVFDWQDLQLSFYPRQYYKN